MKKAILILAGTAVLISVFLFRGPIFNLIVGGESRKDYTNDVYGISFRYEEIYFLEEKEVGDGHRRHYLISLTEDTEENRLVREGKSPGREGPVAITFDIYQNNLDNTSLEEWLKGTNQSNFKLSDGNYRKTTVAGTEALSYRWSGLYEADAVAFSHKENIISGTATYISPDEKIRKDFSEILESLILK